MQKWKYSALFQWIISGCIVLMIPVLCAVINFFINKNLIERKIHQVNDFVLKNVQYNIDDRLSDLQEISRYIQIDESFNGYALSREGGDKFLTQVRKCFSTLKTFATANPDIDVLIYVPGEEYALTSSTANRLEYIWNTLNTKKPSSLNYEDWRSLVKTGYQNEFLISEKLTYNHYGEENFVYASRGLYSYESGACTIFVSASTAFIQSIIDDETMENTILILDQNNHILGSYGQELGLETIDKTWDKEGGNFTMNVAGQAFIGAFIPSRVAKWKYVILTPRAIYMNEIIRNRNLNLLIVMAGLILGMASVIFLQRRNYLPVKRMMKALAIKDRTAKGNEFVLVETNLRRLYHENQSMRDSIKDRKEYDRELFLLSSIRGRKSFFKDAEIESILGYDVKNREFILVTMNLDTEEEQSGSAVADDFELLAFAINNIIGELLGVNYPYLKTVDDMFLVYLFFPEKENGKTGWTNDFKKKFEWLCDYFQKHFNMELAITMSPPFDAFESIEEEYGKIQEANEYRYFVEPYGVMSTDFLKEMDLTLAQRLKYYNRRFELVLAETDFEQGYALTEAFFQEVEQLDMTFPFTRYYVLAVVNDLLLALQSIMSAKELPEDSLMGVLTDMCSQDSKDGLKDQFIFFLKLICKRVNEDSRKSSNLAELVKNYVRENYMDCNMNISTIAQEMGLTPRYLSKLFKDQTGMGLLNYMNEMRIDQAKALLKHSVLTVEEIAEKTGFTNARTFRRNFLKVTGENAITYKRR